MDVKCSAQNEMKDIIDFFHLDRNGTLVHSFSTRKIFGTILNNKWIFLDRESPRMRIKLKEISFL